MGRLEVIFATVVSVLAALAVIGALVFAVVWEWCAIKRTLAAYRRQTRPPVDSARYWRERSVVTVPQRRP
jgi:uncharacterized membrane protein